MVTELTLQPGFSLHAASALSEPPVVLWKTRDDSEPPGEDRAVYCTREVSWRMSLTHLR